jgi:hypothetical protein
MIIDTGGRLEAWRSERENEFVSRSGTVEQNPSAPVDWAVQVAPPGKDSRSGVSFATNARYSTGSKRYRCETGPDAR